jgi:hypothetical protein
MVLALCSLDKGDFREGEVGGTTRNKPCPLVAIQPFSRLAKAGGGVEPIGRTHPKRIHPVKTNAMSLASENQCASETLRDTYLNEQAGTIYLTISGSQVYNSRAGGTQHRFFQ